MTDKELPMLRDVRIGIQGTSPSNIVFHQPANIEMIKITPDGFYVRGEKVPQDADEAQAVYNAFLSFLHSCGMFR